MNDDDRLALIAEQAREYDAWRDAVMAELHRAGVDDINEGGEHERLYDAITFWGEALAQLRLRDPDPEHAERAYAERAAKWERWT